MLFHLWAILLLGSNLLQRAESFGLLPPSKLHLPLPISPASATISLSNKFIRRSWFVTGNTGIEETIRDDILNDLLELIRSTPSNSPTSIQTTDNILTIIRKLEGLCPTEDAKVLPELGGNWELLWTSQDQQSDEWRLGPLRTWINPLENQSYSNNPDGDVTGRSNPVLPRPLQDRLEQIGLIQKDSEASITRSSQAIDLKRKQVRNVVAFNIPSVPEPRKATLTVTVDFEPSDSDKRRVNVKFRACRVAISKSPIDFTIPLGIIGPTGWLRTVYIDDQIRITRGHKGSVFVLSRPSRKQST